MEWARHDGKNRSDCYYNSIAGHSEFFVVCELWPTFRINHIAELNAKILGFAFRGCLVPRSFLLTLCDRNRPKTPLKDTPRISKFKSGNSLCPDPFIIDTMALIATWHTGVYV